MGIRAAKALFCWIISHDAEKYECKAVCGVLIALMTSLCLRTEKLFTSRLFSFGWMHNIAGVKWWLNKNEWCKMIVQKPSKLIINEMFDWHKVLMNDGFYNNIMISGNQISDHQQVRVQEK